MKRNLPEDSSATLRRREIVVGDRVNFVHLVQLALSIRLKTVKAEVRVKALRFREKLENLELVEAAPAPKPQKGKLEKLRRSTGMEVHLSADESSSKSELNVIGQTTDEAVDAVDKFLDEASLASLSRCASYMDTARARCDAQLVSC